MSDTLPYGPLAPSSSLAGAGPTRARWPRRLAVLALLAAAALTVWLTNALLTERYTESTRNRAEVRLALYTGNLMSELQRAQVVPLLLARDPALIGALNSGDFSQASQRLIGYREEIGASALMLVDASGRVMGATNRDRLGARIREQAVFIDALRSSDTVFTTWENEAGGFDFAYSRRMEDNGVTLGVIVVMVNLGQFENGWRGFSDAVMVTESTGRVILATEPRWRGVMAEEALELRSAPSAIERAIQATSDWSALRADAFLSGQAVLRETVRVPFRGWTITSFTTNGTVRQRVNGVLALEIMGFAMALAGLFYYTQRRATSRMKDFERESLELRALNAALEREIAERERAERHLQVAEQTVAQTSKLAALGEMSAGVSHELNQPLAAMKTYLAGAQLLLQRGRSSEALSSFQRIDDLIARMGAITRQLKSYARKGDHAVARVNFGEAVSSALAMMEPQMRERAVAMHRVMPPAPVFVMADRLRLEQIVINLMRNALDATRETNAPRIDLLLVRGSEAAVLTIRDNGHGIADLEKLFEPFYTTKTAGEGTGLGLAISSSIASDFGGRLTARNARVGGAVFELSLPLADPSPQPSPGLDAMRRAAEPAVVTVPSRPVSSVAAPSPAAPKSKDLSDAE